MINDGDIKAAYCRISGSIFHRIGYCRVTHIEDVRIYDIDTCSRRTAGGGPGHLPGQNGHRTIVVIDRIGNIKRFAAA